MHKDMYYSHWFIQLCVPHLRHINFLMQKSCLLSIPLDTQTSSLSIMNRIHHMYSSFIPIIRCFLVLWKPLLILFCVVSWVLLFCIEPFGDRTRPQHHETTPKLNCFSLHDAPIEKPPCYHHRLNQFWFWSSWS